MGIGPSLEDLLPNQKKVDESADESTESKLQDKIQEIDLKDKEREAEAQSQAMNMQYIDLSGFVISYRGYCFNWIVNY